MSKLALMASMLFIVCNRAYASYDSADNLKAYLQIGVKQDSNLFRLDRDEDNLSTQAKGKRSDTIISPEFGASYSRSISRQFFEVKGKYFEPKHSIFGQMDYSGWSGSGAWKWAAGRSLSGDFTYSDGKILSSFEDLAGVTANSPTVIADMVKNRVMSTNFNYLIGNNLQLSAGFSRHDDDHSRTQTLDLKRQGRTFSINYITDNDNSFQIYSSHTTYEYKHNLNLFVSAAERGLSTDQQGVSMKWFYSQKTQLTAAWGQAKTRYISGQVVPKNSVGNFSVIYSPTNKIKINTTLGKTVESGVNGLGRNVLQNITARTDYEFSKKMSIYLSGSYSRREYDSLNQSQPQLDQDANLDLGFSYVPLRNVDVSAFTTVSKRGVKNVPYPAGFEAFVFGFNTRLWF